jgi:beta-lactamase regulating signal transducer with metallopeptidase domain
MRELFKVVLSLSLAGSVLILVICACSALLRQHLSKRWQYYIWLIVVVRLLLPLTPEQGILPALWTREVPPQTRLTEEIRNPQTAVTTTPDLPQESPSPVLQEQPEAQTPGTAQTIWNAVQRYAWVAWLAVAAFLFTRKVTLYQSFVKYLRAGQCAMEDVDTLNRFAEVCEELGIHRPVELTTNRLIASPLLLGFGKPAVVLPSLPENGSAFRYICLHELTHCKRKDIFYKWLLQVTLCIHWFNPLVHLMVRQAGRTCELSCDEAVLRVLPKRQRKEYGDTLLESLKTPGTYREGIAALTLNEGSFPLKERLEAILRFHRPNKIMLAVAILLVTLLFTGGYALGAYRASFSTDTAQTIEQNSANDEYPEADRDEVPEAATKPETLHITLPEAEAPAPDFLDAGQQRLYRQAQTAYKEFTFDNTGFGSIWNEGADDAMLLEYNGMNYYKCNGYLVRWDAFESAMLSVFTPEYYEELNHFPSYTDKDGVFHNRTVFAELEGELYFSGGGRGGNMTFVGPETFELIAKDDDEISFYVIGTYDDYAEDEQGNLILDEDGEYKRAETPTQEKFRIVMKRVEEGWRFSEYQLAY